MSLKAKIDADIKAAMLARDPARLLALRDIKRVILLEETKPGADGDISEADELRLLQKAVKQRKDSAEIFKSQNRQDLLEKELAELAIIEAYLPVAMTEAELEAAVKAIIEQTGAKSPAEIGKVMGVASKLLAGKAEGRAISEMAKKLLA